MSYSINVRKATKDDALAALREDLDKMAAAQPIHEKDKDIALATAEAMVELLMTDGTHDVLVSVNGYLGWATNNDIITADVHATASLVARQPAAAGG